MGALGARVPASLCMPAKGIQRPDGLVFEDIQTSASMRAASAASVRELTPSLVKIDET